MLGCLLLNVSHLSKLTDTGMNHFALSDNEEFPIQIEDQENGDVDNRVDCNIISLDAGQGAATATTIVRLWAVDLTTSLSPCEHAFSLDCARSDSMCYLFWCSKPFIQCAKYSRKNDHSNDTSRSSELLQEFLKSGPKKELLQTCFDKDKKNVSLKKQDD